MLHDNGAIDAALFILVLIPSIILHEIAHGAVALRLGDTTARDAGRLTLNPIPHIDVFGSIILPTVLALSRSNVFGWAKPVPVNPTRFARPVGGMAITALAGPATNIALAMLVGKLGPFQRIGDIVYMTSDSIWASYLLGLLMINAALAVFNLLPIPPLDGSRLVPLLLPERGREVFNQISQYGFVILIVLLFMIPESLGFLGSWMRAVILFAV